MTDAHTGNSMIPSHPGIVQQQVQGGAQQVSPQSPGVAPTNGQQAPTQEVPNQDPSAFDFWDGIEQRIAPETQEPGTQTPASPPAEPTQPQAQPGAQGQPQQPAQAPQPGAAVPPQPNLTPEQLVALAEAQQPTSPQTQQPAQPQFNAQQVEQQAIQHLAAQEYAIPEEVAQQLLSEPEKVYPQLAARMHVRMATQIGQAVQNMLPSIVEQVVSQRMQAFETERQFFSKYQQLSDPRFRPVVQQSLQLARQMYPNANRDQLMENGATIAAMKLQLNLQPTQAQVQPAQMPVASQPPVSMQNVQPQYTAQQVPPFQPAVGGSAGLPNTQGGQPENEFEKLAMDPNW